MITRAGSVSVMRRSELFEGFDGDSHDVDSCRTKFG